MVTRVDNKLTVTCGASLNKHKRVYTMVLDLFGDSAYHEYLRLQKLFGTEDLKLLSDLVVENLL